MKKEEIVQLLQYRRHDLVNDIQVIHGYASMNMIDKVQEKLEDFIRATENERKLHMVAAPSLILWIELFQIHYDHFTLTYDVKKVIDLSEFDEWITEQCEKLMQEVQKQINQEETYTVHIAIDQHTLEKSFVQIIIDQIDLALYERLLDSLKHDEQKAFEFAHENKQLRCIIQIDR